MPPKRIHDNEAPLSLKESKLQSLQGNAARDRRNGKGAVVNGSSLKEVDNASTNSGHTSSDSNPSNIKWSAQDASVLQNYRRAYHLDTPSTFKNPLSHVVLGGQGIGRFSPTMARPKAQRRVHKDQLALAVRKHFNGLGVSENEVIVDWLYKTKNQDKEFRARFAPQRK